MQACLATHTRQQLAHAACPLRARVVLTQRALSVPPRRAPARRLWGRGAYSVVFNEHGQLYVTRRSLRKDVYPGLYDVVTSGVVSAGESYEQCAERELAEEIGVVVGPHTPLERLCTFRWTDAYCRVWGAAFRARCNAADVTHADGEVTSGEWVALPDVEARITAAPDAFTPVGRYVLAAFMQQQRGAQRAAHPPPPQRRRRERGSRGGAC